MKIQMAAGLVLRGHLNFQNFFRAASLVYQIYGLKKRTFQAPGWGSWIKAARSTISTQVLPGRKTTGWPFSSKNRIGLSRPVVFS